MCNHTLKFYQTYLELQPLFLEALLLRSLIPNTPFLSLPSFHSCAVFRLLEWVEILKIPRDYLKLSQN
jgi:hypothetical protein